MPVRKEYTVELKEQAVRYVVEEMEPDESRSAAVHRLAPKLNVRPATLMNWVKAAAAPASRPTPAPGSFDELRAQNAALRKENRELARANEILQAAASFFGRRSTASQRGDRVRRRASLPVRGRADLQGAAGRPVSGPLGVVTPAWAAAAGR